jgi:hypothetical protein
MKTWFKYIAVTILLGVSVACMVLLFEIFSNTQRYQITTDAEGYSKIMDIRTGAIYHYVPRQGYLYYDNRGEKRFIKQLP